MDGALPACAWSCHLWNVAHMPVFEARPIGSTAAAAVTWRGRIVWRLRRAEDGGEQVFQARRQMSRLHDHVAAQVLEGCPVGAVPEHWYIGVMIILYLRLRINKGAAILDIGEEIVLQINSRRQVVVERVDPQPPAIFDIKALRDDVMRHQCPRRIVQGQADHLLRYPR